MALVSFSERLMKIGTNSQRLATAAMVRNSAQRVLPQLHEAIRSPELESWFAQEAGKRMATVPAGLDSKALQDALEMGNRYPDGSMQPISLAEMVQMKDLLLSPQDIIDRARQGVELLANNPLSDELGTAVRGIPGGGASSRASKWARLNPEAAAKLGITEETARPLYRVADKALLQRTIEMSREIARNLGRVFPNLVMTNSELVGGLLDIVRQEWHDFKPAELDNTIFFNQIVLPRMWVKDQEMIDGKLYPAGHGDFPYLLSLYNMAKTLRSVGSKYLVFSNADEWLWQADPVMISIAEQYFRQGNHMVIIGVENTNNQFGGGFVKKADGSQSLVETPRLPYEIVKAGRAPIALNTTFYFCDVDYLAEHEERMMAVDKSLAVKEVPGRTPGTVEQIFGVDSWAGDIFAEILNPAFIQWPRLNFLGIKDGGFIAGTNPESSLGGRSYRDYMLEAAAAYPGIVKALISGDRAQAEALHGSGYSYLPPTI